MLSGDNMRLGATQSAMRFKQEYQSQCSSLGINSKNTAFAKGEVVVDGCDEIDYFKKHQEALASH